MDRVNFQARKLYRRILQSVSSRFYINPDTDLEKTILVAGTARSGTTWLGDLITANLPCRILFEPFNSNLVPEYHGFHYFQYMRPGTQDERFRAFAEKVFTGKIRNLWIDRYNERIFSQIRLVKEIRANLSLKWLHDKFPQVPIIFLLRHPCAVVLSRMELQWATDGDIQPLVSQPELVSDYLAEHLDFIKAAKTDEEKHAIIWSINNLVPFRQFKAGELKVMYYEYICTQPEIELPNLFSFIGREYDGKVDAALNRPSQTTRESSAIVSGNNKISSWKKKLSTSQIENILRVVARFGLDDVYTDSIFPLNKQRLGSFG